MSNIWSCVLSCVCPASQPCSMAKTFQPKVFIPDMHIGTIDFHHFIPLWQILMLTGVHKVSTKQNLLASFFFLSFSFFFFALIRMKFDMVLKQLKLNILRLLSSEIWLNMRNNSSFIDVYEWIWFKLGLMIDTAELYIEFESSLVDLELDSGSQECKKAKTSAPVVSKFSINLDGIW